MLRLASTPLLSTPLPPPPRSYGYDGRRRMRWHTSHAPYGEQWAAGDVIGCCVDLDAGRMSFYRNGKDLVRAPGRRGGGGGLVVFQG